MATKEASNAVIGYYWQRISKYKRQVIGIVAAVPLTVLVNSFLPSLIIAKILLKISGHHYNHSVWHSFGPSLIAYFFLVVFGVFTWRLVDYFDVQLESRVEKDMAEEVFAHMLDETIDFHSNNFSGSLVSQSNKLLSGYIRMADTTVFQTLPLILSLIFTAVILAPRAPLFTALLLVFAVLYVLAALRVSGPVRKLSAYHAAKESKQTGFLADAITNVMAIKSFARGKFERERFSDSTQETQTSLYDFIKVQRKMVTVMGFISQIISTMALLLAVISVVVFKANIATVFLIVNYTTSIVSQLFSFSNSSLRNYNRSIGDAQDMVEILSNQPEVQDPVKPEESRIKKGAVHFNKVLFTHNQAESAIFNAFDIDIKAGQKVGLVGHSGSGKSTLIRLLLRFSDIEAGTITIDNQNIADITQDDLHLSIAYVPQEPLLFHRSIAENIAYGKPNATLKDIRKASKQAHADEFIKSLPLGYETLVGERGVKLSGGQRQRVAIARALLKNAPILVLDEATSSLDSESEVLIQDALWKLMEGRTALVIAHRLSTIQKMDRILVLADGKIVEDGNHNSLLKLDGTYAKLWKHQSGGFIPDDDDED
jgi:ATP-binding cassette subfamily B protein